jgi:hypothetical protein
MTSFQQEKEEVREQIAKQALVVSLQATRPTLTAAALVMEVPVETERTTPVQIRLLVLQEVVVAEELATMAVMAVMAVRAITGLPSTLISSPHPVMAVVVRILLVEVPTRPAKPQITRLQDKLFWSSARWTKHEAIFISPFHMGGSLELSRRVVSNDRSEF